MSFAATAFPPSVVKEIDGNDRLLVLGDRAALMCSPAVDIRHACSDVQNQVLLQRRTPPSNAAAGWPGLQRVVCSKAAYSGGKPDEGSFRQLAAVVWDDAQPRILAI